MAERGFAFRQAYDAYDALVVSLVQELAQNDEAIRGFYGKTSGVVAEFGTKVLAAHGGRKTKGKPQPQSAPLK